MGNMPGSEAPTTQPATRMRRIDARDASEIFIFSQPPSTEGDDIAQFQAVAAGALAAMRKAGVEPTDIFWGVLYVAKDPDWSCTEALAEAFGFPPETNLPITVIVQPPIPSGMFCTLHLKLLNGLPVWHGVSSLPRASTVLRQRQRHLHLLSITPNPDLATNATFASTAYDLFARARHELLARGLFFTDVVRTWIYMRDIHADYGALNWARNHFFAEQKLHRLPASTGIAGALVGSQCPIAMDLYAISSDDSQTVTALTPTSMGEATAYGSAFARGTVVQSIGKRIVYLSGTASIDREGNVVGIGDPECQIDNMLKQVSALLAIEQMTWTELMSATVYLSDASLYDIFQSSAKRHGLPDDLPMAIVKANICRPDWLCEMEVVAAK
jgi:enamine deaminase RidA (YjgF/YER057c/UK114 family)